MTMKRIAILAAFFIGILLSAMLGVILGRLCLSRTCGMPPDTRTLQPQDTVWLMRNLKLPQEQQAAVKQLEQDYRATLTAQCASHCATRAKLQSVLFTADAGVDDAAIRVLVDDLGKAQTACELATIRHIQSIYALLTPAQQGIYEKAVAASVCGTCPTGLHSCQETDNLPAADNQEPQSHQNSALH